VTLHETLEEARASGCPPCKRCDPEGSTADQESAALVEAATRTIDSLAFHRVELPRIGTHPLTGPFRFNLTFRRAR
jgi:methylphosphotriester-DNA--protein-cysteine methyltransferase